MLEQTKLTTHKAGRVAISVLLTGALLMPAFPLSEVLPAYADPVSSNAAVEASSNQDDRSSTSFPVDRINMDVPLDGTLIVAQGQTQSPLVTQQTQQTAPQKTEEEKQAILDSYLADGTITEDDLDNEFIVSSLTGSYLEQNGDGGGVGLWSSCSRGWP